MTRTAEAATLPAPGLIAPELTALLADLLREALAQVVATVTPPDPELKLYTPAEVAELLGVTENWVSERVNARSIHCTFVGRFPRFTAQHIRDIATAGEIDPATFRPRSQRKAS